MLRASSVVGNVPFIILNWKHTQHLNAHQIKDLQNKKLRAIIKHSYNHVPYYHTLFKKSNLSPDDIKTSEDLKKVPITKKTDIRGLPINDITADNFVLTDCEKRFTSGSSGIPLTCYRDGKGFLKRCFDEYLFHNGHGAKFSDNRVLMGGIVPLPPNVLQRFGLLRTKEVSPLKPPSEQLKIIKDTKAKILLTNPSSALAISKEAKEKDIKCVELALIFTVGERLDNSSRGFIEETFNAKVIDQYGATEVGKISRECIEHNYHLHQDVLVQSTKEDETLVAGEEGEITVTNLVNFVQPSIRYNLEDSGVVLTDECSCDLHYPLMRLTAGRAIDVINLPNGRSISALEVNDFLSLRPIELRQYQVIQEALNKLTVKVVKGKGFEDNTVLEIEQTYRQNLGSEMQVNVLIVDDIPREKSGKFKLFKNNYIKKAS